MTITPALKLTRAERLQLAAAALRGVLAGAARAIITWLLDHLSQPRPGPHPPLRARPADPIPGSDSQGNPDFRKITRNLSLTFAAFGDTGQGVSHPIQDDDGERAGLRSANWTTHSGPSIVQLYVANSSW